MTAPGDRVELDSTTDPYTRVLPGTRGTVTSVDDLGTIHVAWDGGARLGLIPGVDHWHPIGKER
jgi:Domain of unknown function (DUF4314)